MARAQAQIRAAVVGVAEPGNSAVFVTLDADGALLDRRRVDLTHDLPTHPYHHEGSWAIGRYADSPWARPISLPEAIALECQFNADLFDRETVRRWMGVYQVLLAAAAEAPSTEVGLLPATTEADLATVAAWNGATRADYPASRCAPAVTCAPG